MGQHYTKQTVQASTRLWVGVWAPALCVDPRATYKVWAIRHFEQRWKELRK